MYFLVLCKFNNVFISISINIVPNRFYNIKILFYIYYYIIMTNYLIHCFFVMCPYRINLCFEKN
jgi:hypothetical protein